MKRKRGWRKIENRKVSRAERLAEGISEEGQQQKTSKRGRPPKVTSETKGALEEGLLPKERNHLSPLWQEFYQTVIKRVQTKSVTNYGEREE